MIFKYQTSFCQPDFHARLGKLSNFELDYFQLSIDPPIPPPSRKSKKVSALLYVPRLTMADLFISFDSQFQHKE